MALTVVVTDGALIGSDEVEFIFGVADLAGDSENQIAAAGGGDLVLADAGLVQVTPLTVHNNTTASAVDLDDPLFWTRDENPLFGDSGVPHTTALVELKNAESEVFGVTVGAGQTITVDIDMKDISNASGEVVDLIVELVDAAGNVFALNDNGPVANDGLGSFAFFGRTDSFDPFLTFTAPAAGRYFIVVRPRPFTFFADSAIVLLNVSVTGHAVTTNTPMGDDTLNGGAGDDRLFGQGGNDIIDGGTGADLIHGGSGADLVHGGEGNDTLHTGGNGQYFGDAGNDLIVAGLRNAGTQIFDGGAGLDTLDTRAFNGDYIIDLAAGTSNIAGESFTGFEGVITGNGNDIASGTSSGDDIHTSGGNDRLDGLAGDDTLSGGAGNDVLNGGNGNDTADYTRAGSGVTAQLNSNTSTRDGDGGTDTFSSIENLTGSLFDDILIGDAGANRLVGASGADTLIGLGGDDFLFGGGGALNTLQGGLGNDHYLLQEADSVVEFAGEGTDLVEVAFAPAYTLPENVENLIFRPGFNARGTGNSAANVITGVGGDDVLRGRGGADVLNGGAGSDTADYTLAAAGVVVRIDLLRATNDGDGSTDTYTSIENAIGSNFNDVMFGDGNANLLQGGIGSDILIGGGGNDTLMGGSGGVNNQLQGGTGDDRYILDAFDTIVELAGEGIDTVESRVGSYTLGANVENLFYTGPGSFVGTGNALNNVITGGARNDILRGGGGNDTINGGLGTDELQLRGVLADYAITVEGAGYRIIDRVAGRDGSTFVDSVEVLRFANNTIRTLAYPVAGALLASEAIGAGLDPDESPIAALDRLFPPTGDRMLTLDPDIGLPGQPCRDFDWMM